jgi:hypothetical protein
VTHNGERCLILIDQLMSYVSRSRTGGMTTQLDNFLHTLVEEGAWPKECRPDRRRWRPVRSRPSRQRGLTSTGATLMPAR